MFYTEECVCVGVCGGGGGGGGGGVCVCVCGGGGGGGGGSYCTVHHPMKHRIGALLWLDNIPFYSYLQCCFNVVCNGIGVMQRLSSQSKYMVYWPVLKWQRYKSNLIGVMCIFWECTLRADSRLAPSHRERALLCNDVSHWLGASLESGLTLCVGMSYILLFSFIKPHVMSPTTFQINIILNWYKESFHINITS